MLAAQSKSRLCLLPLAAALALATTSWAGPLFPPQGEPSPTMKRLDEVSVSRCISSLPHVITEPGTYDLCGNLSGGGDGKSAITVASSGVTIDLKGFSLTGVQNSGKGIEVLPGFSTVTVRNGVLDTWGGGALFAPDLADARCVDLAVRSCGGEAGIMVAGGTIERCVVSSCALDGVRVSSISPGDSVRLRDSSCSSNGGNGFSLAGVSFDMDSCVSSGNLGSGFQVLLPAAAKAQDHNSSRSNKTSSIANGGDGFLVLAGEGSVATIDLGDSSSSGNTGAGVRVVCTPQDEVTVRMTGCSSSSNESSGVLVQDALVELDRCVIEKNTSHGLHLVSSAAAKAQDHNSSRSNKTSSVACGGNGGDGILLETLGAGSLSFVGTDSSSSSNGGNGLRCVGSTEIDLDRCVLSGNTLHGLHLDGSSSPSEMRASLERCRLSRNSLSGVVAPTESQGTAELRLSSTTIDRCGAQGILMATTEVAPGALSLFLDRCDVTRCVGDGVSVQGGGEGNASSLTVLDSSITGNQGAGLDVSCEDATVAGTRSSGNGGGGLVCGSTKHFRSSSSSFTGNTGPGLDVDCPIVEISSSSCTGNIGVGAAVSGSSLAVSGCVFSGNQGTGLHLLDGSGHVVSNVVAGNRDFGILVDGSGLSLGENVVSGHRNATGDAAGIRVNSPGNRVVGNLFDDCDDAVALYADGNPVYENSTTAGTNPLFESPGISGNGAPTSGVDTATNPFTNILH